MINCVPKQVKRGAIQFGPHSYIEIRSLIGDSNMYYHKGQALVNTKRHGWQNVDFGDYLVFDEGNRLLKVLSPEDFGNNYTVE